VKTGEICYGPEKNRTRAGLKGFLARQRYFFFAKGDLRMNLMVTPGRTVMGRLPKGCDLLSALEEGCRDLGIKLGEVRALGAVSQAKIGYYDQAAQKYLFLEFPRPMEILSLLGNVSLKDGQAFVHAHLTLGEANGQSWGGHLAPGTVVFACEYVIQEFISLEPPLARALDKDTGLFLWPEKPPLKEPAWTPEEMRTRMRSSGQPGPKGKHP
jgi:predicted DNA-binding protein with PD1-like motif